jgi:SAM-dependent methyltransferase
MPTANPEFSQLKAAIKSAWMAGDFGQVAAYNTKLGEEFVKGTPIKSGEHILDVACGTGNVAIPAARAGAVVTGVDIAANLIEQARKRAAAEGLKIRFEEGDAEALPYGDREFDTVLTMFGAMFAPRPEKVAAELIRVCKPGGSIAMANWTPGGFVGKSFQVTAKFAPPPPGVPAPVLWGDEETVRQRFSSGIASLNMTRTRMAMEYPFGPKEVVGFFRQYFGPTQMAFARLDNSAKDALATELESLWAKHNTATDGSTRVEIEYLDVRAVRA